MLGTQWEKDVSSQLSALVPSLYSRTIRLDGFIFPQCLVWIESGGRAVLRTVSGHMGDNSLIQNHCNKRENAPDRVQAWGKPAIMPGTGCHPVWEGFRPAHTS